MTYQLLEHPNPHGPHYYTSRRAEVHLGVIHTGENLPDWDGDDTAAEALAGYASRAQRAVSWHDTTDSDSEVPTLPLDHTAFHVRGYNSRSVGVEQATRAAAWGDAPDDWVQGIIDQTSIAVARWVDEYDLPVRRITKAQADAGYPGLIDHARLDPDRRSDPGRDYPWALLLDVTAERVGLKSGPSKPAPDPDPVRRADRLLLQFGDAGDAVEDWQAELRRWEPRALPQFGADGTFGGETRYWTRAFQRYARIQVDGIVGGETREAMARHLRGRLQVDPAGGFTLGDYAGTLLTQPPVMRHDAVDDWQRALNAWRPDVVKVDGAYGPITETWTVAFQRTAGLRYDGIVGPKTWGAMRTLLRG